MEPLFIELSVNSPGVILSPQIGKFIIYGNSYPVNYEIYNRIYNWFSNWFSNYIETINRVCVIQFQLENIDSNSAKHIVRLLKLFKRSENIHIEIIWYTNNSDINSLGYFLSKSIDLNINLIRQIIHHNDLQA